MSNQKTTKNLGLFDYKEEETKSSNNEFAAVRPSTDSKQSQRRTKESRKVNK